MRLSVLDPENVGQEPRDRGLATLAGPGLLRDLVNELGIQRGLRLL